MMEKLYAEDKPKSCEFCYYWNGKKKGCVLGKDNCYYLLKPVEKKPSPCDGCPYGAHQPCVGFCMKKILGQGAVK